MSWVSRSTRLLVRTFLSILTFVTRLLGLVVTSGWAIAQTDGSIQYQTDGRVVMKPDLWILPLIVNNKPGELITRAQLAYVLKALEEPRSDGTVVKKLSDGDIWLKGVFSREAVFECFQEESQDWQDNWNRSLILLRKYKILHVVKGVQHEFQLLVEEFSFWESQQGFAPKRIPIYCMKEPAVQKKVEDILKENEKEDTQEQLSVSSVALSDLLDQMTPPDCSQTATAPKTPQKADKPSSSANNNHLNHLPDSPPLLQPDFLLDERICTQERQQLDDIEEWKPDYVPPKMKDSSEDDSVESSPALTRPRAGLGCEDSASQEQALLQLNKRTLEGNSSGSETTSSKAAITPSSLYNGDMNFVDRHRERQIDQTEKRSPERVESSDGNKKNLVSTSAQVGESLQVMAGTSAQVRGSPEPMDCDTVSERQEPEKRSSSAEKGAGSGSSNCNSDSGLTPMVIETQGQRVSSSESHSDSRAAVEDDVARPDTQETAASQDSDAGALQVDTQVQPRQRLVKDIGGYQETVDLSCDMMDDQTQEPTASTEKEKGNEARVTTPVRSHSTQRPGADSPGMDLSLSPVIAAGDTENTHTEKQPRPSTPQPSTSRGPQTDTDLEGGGHMEPVLCEGGYFSLGISPPLVLPSSSHVPAGPVSPNELHSPLHPPAKPKDSTHTPLLKKSPTRKLSPTRKTPSKTGQLPFLSDPSSSRKQAARTPSQERKETLEEENRLASLSGRKELRYVQEDAQSIASYDTVHLGPQDKEADFDPVAIELSEKEREMVEFRKASSGIEIVDVKLQDVSPRERKLKKLPTLEITAISPTKLNKFYSSVKSQASTSKSETSSKDSASAVALKSFSIGKRRNKMDISLTILDKDAKVSKPKRKTRPKNKTCEQHGDVTVLFASPDKPRKSVSDSVLFSQKTSMAKRRRKVKLYKESMLMPTEQESSAGSDALSTPNSDMLLVSNSSSDSVHQKTQRVNEPTNPTGRLESSASDLVDLGVMPMTQEMRHAHKDRFLEMSQATLTASATKKLKISPRVQMPGMTSIITPTFSLTAAQRSRGDVWRASSTRSSSAGSSDTTRTTRLLLDLGEQLEKDVTESQKQLLNVPLSLELSTKLDNYLTLQKFSS